MKNYETKHVYKKYSFIFDFIQTYRFPSATTKVTCNAGMRKCFFFFLCNCLLLQRLYYILASKITSQKAKSDLNFSIKFLSLNNLNWFPVREGEHM